MSENTNEREAWDTGEPAARSHEQYRAPVTEEPQATEVVGNPELVSEQQDEGPPPEDNPSEESTTADAGADSDDSES